MIPGTFGLLVAMALGIAVFGKLDGMTLAFGGSLIGVTVDYPTHQLHPVEPVGAGRVALAALAPARRDRSSMAALTTIASFAGMGFTSFPGFRELGALLDRRRRRGGARVAA